MIGPTVFSNPDTLARALALDIARALAASPALVIGLPAGQTPVPLYRELTRLHARGRADFSRATIFGLDEFLGIAPNDAHSFQTFVRRHLLDHLDVDARRVHFLNGSTANPKGECGRYERAIRRAGGIDLQILGLGRNGHVGFNEPAPSLIAATHRIRLTTGTRRANAVAFGGKAAAVPTHALSMGMATILRARRIVLIATGSGKSRGVEQLLTGEITTRFPASLLQIHPHADVWLDRAAAARFTSS